MNECAAQLGKGRMCQAGQSRNSRNSNCGWLLLSLCQMTSCMIMAPNQACALVAGYVVCFWLQAVVARQHCWTASCWQHHEPWHLLLHAACCRPKLTIGKAATGRPPAGIITMCGTASPAADCAAAIAGATSIQQRSQLHDQVCLRHSLLPCIRLGYAPYVWQASC